MNHLKEDIRKIQGIDTGKCIIHFLSVYAEVIPYTEGPKLNSISEAEAVELVKLDGSDLWFIIAPFPTLCFNSGTEMRLIKDVKSHVEALKFIAHALGIRDREFNEYMVIRTEYEDFL